jgi:epoxyqueuosine reductase
LGKRSLPSCGGRNDNPFHVMHDSMSISSQRVLDRLKVKGWSCGIVPIGRLRELQYDLDSLFEQGLVDAKVREAYLNEFKYEAPRQMPDARSIIIVAVPQPRLRIHFTFEGRDVAAIVPPTYANAWTVINGVRSFLEEITVEEGGKFEKASLPLKTLAARTGLVKYGRNNITYLPENGSYHRLVAYFSNLDLKVDQWQEREALAACKTCEQCSEACPASVICNDRFLVHVERCLTFLNEMSSDRPFPDKVKAEWHNAIVGCMRCQDACPYDKKVNGWTDEGETFSEEETCYLLKGEFSDARSKAMNDKLERSGLDLTIFPRNLVALLGM